MRFENEQDDVFFPGHETPLMAFRTLLVPGEGLLWSFSGSFETKSGWQPIIWNGTWALSQIRLFFMGQGGPHRKFQMKFHSIGGRWPRSGWKKNTIITIPYEHLKLKNPKKTKILLKTQVLFIHTANGKEKTKKNVTLLMIPQQSKTLKKQKDWKKQYINKIEMIYRQINYWGNRL
ncbi:MAG: hypothetical protein ACTSRC_19455 [Candidatus Helarchaeota archaeon]